MDESVYLQWQKFQNLTVQPPFIVRLDGNDFHKLPPKHKFKKPFDEKFHFLMVNTAKNLLTKTEFKISLAYTTSDEINLLFSDNFIPYNGRIEKILSLLASYATSAFQFYLLKVSSKKEFLSFDAKIIKVNSFNDILEYFSWRTFASIRNFLNAYGKTILGEKNILRLKGKELVEKLIEKGFNVDSMPKWQKYGTTIYWKTVKKEGFNPVTGKKVYTYRRKLAKKIVDFTDEKGKGWFKSYFKYLERKFK